MGVDLPDDVPVDLRDVEHGPAVVEAADPLPFLADIPRERFRQDELALGPDFVDVPEKRRRISRHGGADDGRATVLEPVGPPLHAPG